MGLGWLGSSSIHKSDMGYWRWTGTSVWLLGRTHTHGCSISLSFLTAWWPKGSLTQWLRVQGSECKCSSKQGRSFKAFFHLAEEVMGHHFCHFQLATTSQKPAQIQVEGISTYLSLEGLYKYFQTCFKTSTVAHHHSLSFFLKEAPSSSLLGPQNNLEVTIGKSLKCFSVPWPWLSFRVAAVLWEFTLLQY